MPSPPRLLVASSALLTAIVFAAAVFAAINRELAAAILGTACLTCFALLVVAGRGYHFELHRWLGTSAAINDAYRNELSRCWDGLLGWKLEQCDQHERTQRLLVDDAQRLAAAATDLKQREKNCASEEAALNSRRAGLDREEENRRLREQQHDIHRTRVVREALAWWTTEYPHLDERADAFWSDIIGQAANYRTRYEDPAALCSTAERALELATWALDTIPAELGHFFMDGQPTVDELASILRRYHGREVEELLPRARARQRADRLRPDAVPSDPSPFADLLADLPAAMRAELSRNINAVIHLDDVRAITANILEHRKRQLEADGVPHDVIDERLAALDENLARATREFARRRGLV